MRLFQSTFFRALTAIAVGVLLVKYPDHTVTGITIAIGVLFFLSGIVSVLSYLNARRHEGEYKIFDAEGRQIAGHKPIFPVVGIGSMILGGILALMPATFVSALMYVIGGMLVLGAIGQFMAIIAARRYGRVAVTYWICPALILLVGLYVMAKPMQPFSMAMLILGWLMLFYGIVEAVNAMVFAGLRRRWEKEQAEIAEAPIAEVTEIEALEVEEDTKPE